MKYEYNAVEIKSRINALFDKRGEKPYKIMKSIGLGQNTLDSNNASMPKADTLARIADYLDVSVDFLLGRFSHGLGLSRDELSLLELFRALPDSYRSELLSYSQFLCNKAEADAIKKEKASS